MFDQIAWLTGMPRSGTNWISQILASHADIRMKFCPLFSYEFKNLLNENSSAQEWRDLFRMVYETKGDFLDQEHLRQDGGIPVFREKRVYPRVLAIKSNRFHHLTPGLIEKCPDIRWIALVRHPCAVIYSWLSNPLEFPITADPSQNWRTGFCRKTHPGEYWGFDDWKTVTAMFVELQQSFPDRFRVFRYEEFVRAAHTKTSQMFSWLGLEVTIQTEEFLHASQSIHSDDKRAVFKDPTTTERWRYRLDPDIRNTIEQEVSDEPYLSPFLEPAVS